MSSVVLTEAGDVTPSLAEPQGSTYWLTRFLILRLLGIVYLAAFLSLAVQVLPLIGAHGLLPAATQSNVVAARTVPDGAWFAVPSSVWTLIESVPPLPPA